MSTLHFDTSTPSSEFEKVREIGKGGYGIVAEILHKPTGTRLAGKLIDPKFVEDENSKVLQSEISVLKETSSPYTIKYYGTIKFEGKLCILMDLCDRGSLRDIIDYRNEVLTEEQIAFVMHDLLMALKILHKKQIIHRDIKAANILVTSKGDIKVTDFGVSRQFDATAKTLSTMSIIGTPYWMAPEVIEGRKYSFPADIWSVGTTAVELAEGGPPYCEFPPTRAMVEISSRGFPGFRNGNSLSDEFQDFVSRCMVINPAKRATPEELLQHPFITQINNLDREDVFYYLVKDEIDFSKLLEDEEEEEEEEEENPEIDLGHTVEVSKPEKPSKLHQRPKTKEVKRGYETFISKCAPGTVVEDLYQTSKVPKVESQEEEHNKPEVTYHPAKTMEPQAKSEPPKQNQNTQEGGDSCCIY
ncbi:STE family protein kinase [Histomonas meleagridis]|uniref:STE family protein kinase n=1 Tax=Histomonas meleagridis TaxID=135588 RepID=UPI003559D2BA|nr:STE family protein kinase [Histomonas meleagridis]KAH0798748.1 STE family protein kinase [Histomonas meleagridis]